jgi:hypothetical protein
VPLPPKPPVKLTRRKIIRHPDGLLAHQRGQIGGTLRFAITDYQLQILLISVDQPKSVASVVSFLAAV